MQLSSKFITLTAFPATAFALALDPRASPGSVAVVSYALPECSQTSAAGNLVASVQTLVAQNNCTDLPPTTSFKTFLATPCPVGSTAEVMVYSLKGCSGQSVTERGITMTSGACMEDDDLGGGIGGMSALMECVAA